MFFKNVEILPKNLPTQAFYYRWKDLHLKILLQIIKPATKIISWPTLCLIECEKARMFGMFEHFFSSAGNTTQLIPPVIN